MDLKAVNKAVFAHAAYDPDSYDPAKTGYLVDKEASGPNHTTFYNPVNKKAVVSYRGTDVKNTSDLLADGFIFAGAESLSARFREAERTANAVTQKYGSANVSVTGHSLGGAQALYVNRRLGLEADAYNPGAGLETAKRGFVDRTARVLPGVQVLATRHDPVSAALAVAGFGTIGTRKKQNATIHSTGIDPISVSALLGDERKEFTAPKKGLDVHTVRNFL